MPPGLPSDVPTRPAAWGLMADIPEPGLHSERSRIFLR